MIKVDINRLVKAVDKIMRAARDAVSLWLRVSEGKLGVYYADRYCMLVDILEAETDESGSYIVPLLEFKHILDICRPRTADVIVDKLELELDESRHLIKLCATKRLKPKETQDTQEQQTAEAVTRINRYVAYRQEGESPRDAKLIKADYKALWTSDIKDKWSKYSLINYLKEMTSMGGNIIIYSKKRSLFYTQNARFIALQQLTEGADEFSLAFSLSGAKTLIEILSHMDGEDFAIYTRKSDSGGTSIVLTDTEGKEAYSCEAAKPTKQDAVTLSFFHGLCADAHTESIRINKNLLRDAVTSLLSKKAETYKAEIGDGRLLLSDLSARGENVYRLSAKLSDSSLISEKFILDLKALQMMLPYLTGDEITISLITRDEDKYLRFMGTEDNTAEFYSKRG